MRTAVLVICLGFLAVSAAPAADWPQYRGDAARSGYTAEGLPGKLKLQWTHHPAHPPMPAWRGTDTRMPFDHAYHVAVAGETLYFGSSADHKVYALNAKTGEERWTFFTDAPVRFAPVAWKDRVFAVSDDGHLYCLSAKDGSLLWKKRGGPGDNMLLGNDQMVARWPARGGVAVIDDAVYFAAGIWPTEGIFIYALDPMTGETRWLNDSAGSIAMDQPHPTAFAESGVSAQGYLATANGYLLVPTGRAVPAAFNRSDGTFCHFRLQENGHSGGTPTAGAGEYYVNAGRIYRTADGAYCGSLNTEAAAITPEHIVCATNTKLKVLPRANLIAEVDAVDRKGNPTKRMVLAEPLGNFELPAPGAVSIIVAGTTAAYGAKTGEIVAMDLKSGKTLWSDRVEGIPLGLAMADERLFVSSDNGAITCFGQGRARGAKAKRAKAGAPAYEHNERVAQAAKRIVEAAKASTGYCVDLGCADGALAYELAKLTDLHIYAVDADAAKVREARQKLDAAGLYGVRVTVHEAKPEQTPYSKWFANLVVSGRSTEGGPAPAKEGERLVKPCGGWLCLGAPEAWDKAPRGSIADSGTWTHQYATPANTCSSEEKSVKAPLNMLWFRDTDFEMPSRHGRGPSPLFRDGRLFVEGLNAIRAIDAYNGLPLWDFPLPGILVPYDQEHLVGTAGTNSNLCMDEKFLYVRSGTQCLRLDPATGEQLGTYDAPGTWGYIAVTGDTLFGSVCNEEHVVHWAYRESDMEQVFTESSLFFAMDTGTGAVKWTFKPEHSIRHNAIAIGDDRVYLIDRPLDFGDLLESIRKRRGEPTAPSEPQPPVLYALNAKTGEAVWTSKEDIYGTLLAIDLERDILLMTQQYTRFKLPSEKGGRMTAFRASDGTRLWDAPSDPQGKASRPLLIGGTIFNEPGAWDILTGKRLDWQLERSYGCGIMSGCETLLLYRSATLGYVDIPNKSGTINYGGIRPGCWINAIPAGGLVLMPDATARCTCSYLIRAWVALQGVN